MHVHLTKHYACFVLAGIALHSCATWICSVTVQSAKLLDKSVGIGHAGANRSSVLQYVLWLPAALSWPTQSSLLSDSKLSLWQPRAELLSSHVWKSDISRVPLGAGTKMSMAEPLWTQDLFNQGAGSGRGLVMTGRPVWAAQCGSTPPSGGWRVDVTNKSLFHTRSVYSS